MAKEPSADAFELTTHLHFMQALWALVHALEKTSKHMRREVGVTGPQRLVLRVVGLHPGISAGQLAAVLHVHPSTLTGILQRLADQRLLLRQADASDRRRAILHLTARGARLNRLREGTVEAAVSRALRRVSDRDRATTRRVLGVIADGLSSACLGVADRAVLPHMVGIPTIV